MVDTKYKLDAGDTSELDLIQVFIKGNSNTTGKSHAMNVKADFLKEITLHVRLTWPQ